MKRPVFLLVSTVAAICAMRSARAADLFWDTNGETAGSANDTTHTWGVDAFWSTDLNGAIVTGAYVPGSDVFFSAGTNATGTNTIAVSGVQNANSLTFQEGTVTLNSTAPLAGGLSLGAGGITLVNAPQGNVTLSTSLGGGILLTANQSWTNNTNNRTLTANAIISGNAATGQTLTLTIVGTGGTGTTSLGTTGFGGINDGISGGSLAIVKTGGATLNLGGTNTYTGGTTVNGGNVVFGTGAGTVPASGMITIGAAGTLAANGSDGLTNVGAWLTSGKIAAGANGAIGIHTATTGLPIDFTSYPNLFLGSTIGGGSIYSGTLTPGATGYNLGGGGQTLTVASVLDQPTSLVVGKSSTVALSGDNTYSGLTTVSSGTLVANHTNALGSTAVGATVLAGATLAVGNGITTNPNEAVTIAGSGVNSVGALSTASAAGTSGTWAGNVFLGDSLARVGATVGNTLTITGSIQDSGANTHLFVSGQGLGGGLDTQGTIILASSLNGYTGETRLIRGNLKIGVDNALPTTTVLDMHQTSLTSDPGTFDLNGFNQTIAGLKRTAGNAVTTITNSVGGAPKTLTINQDFDSTYGGGTAEARIAGNLTLVKGGSGTLVLDNRNVSDNNSYSGGTILKGGTLSAAFPGVLGTGDVSVLSTAIELTIHVDNIISDTATLSLAGGGMSGIADNGYVSIHTNGNETVRFLILGGIPQVAGTYGSTASGAQFRSDEYFSGGGMITVAVPEPGAGAVLLGGFGALLGLRRPPRRSV